MSFPTHLFLCLLNGFPQRQSLFFRLVRHVDDVVILVSHLQADLAGGALAIRAVEEEAFPCEENELFLQTTQRKMEFPTPLEGDHFICAGNFWRNASSKCLQMSSRSQRMHIFMLSSFLGGKNSLSSFSSGKNLQAAVSSFSFRLQKKKWLPIPTIRRRLSVEKLKGSFSFGLVEMEALSFLFSLLALTWMSRAREEVPLAIDVGGQRRVLIPPAVVGAVAAATAVVDVAGVVLVRELEVLAE